MITIIIPTLNEVNNILPTYALLKDIFNEIKLKFEIIFVDDKSSDGSIDKIVNLIEFDNRVSIITPKEKLGLGNALLCGYKKSKGEYILFLDCDLSVQKSNIQNLIKNRDERLLIIGSRYIKKSKIININRFKIFFSYSLNYIFSKIFFIKAIDISHSFRIFPKVKLDNINILSHPGFFWELTFILNKKFNLEILELPITFSNRINGLTKNSLKKMLISCIYSFIYVIILRIKKWKKL